MPACAMRKTSEVLQLVLLSSAGVEWSVFQFSLVARSGVVVACGVWVHTDAPGYWRSAKHATDLQL